MVLFLFRKDSISRLFFTCFEQSQEEIALLLGYSEQAPFNRAFRKATGKTPGKWRAEFNMV